MLSSPTWTGVYVIEYRKTQGHIAQGVNIEMVNTFKYQGIHINDNLSFKSDIE